MRKVLNCFLFVLSVILISNAQPGSSIDKPTIVKIVFEVTADVFPSSWYGGEINAKAESLSLSEQTRSAKIVKKAISKYPDKLIKSNLHKVYVFKSLEFFGVPYGGTYTTGKIYLANNGVLNNYTDEYIERGFHEEFSSILKNNYSQFFEEDLWKTINGNGFIYNSLNGYEAIQSGHSSEGPDKEVYEKGFLTEYGMSTMENDFNSFAKQLFLPDKNFWKVTEDYEKLMKKRDLVINFYNKIDTIFTKDFFKNFSIN